VIDLLGTALGLAPFAEEAIRALVARDAHANFIKLVERDLRASHRVPGAQRDAVAQAWAGQRVDPERDSRLGACSTRRRLRIIPRSAGEFRSSPRRVIRRARDALLVGGELLRASWKPRTRLGSVLSAV